MARFPMVRERQDPGGVVMSAPVKQVLCDHISSDLEPPVADPSRWLVDVDWSTGFEYGGVR